MRAICVAAQGDQQAAMNQLQEIRDLPELSQLIEAEALHAASVMVLETRDESLLPEAESACRSAIKLSPAVKYRITLGRIQLEQGRLGTRPVNRQPTSNQKERFIRVGDLA